MYYVWLLLKYMIKRTYNKSFFISDPLTAHGQNYPSNFYPKFRPKHIYHEPYAFLFKRIDLWTIFVLSCAAAPLSQLMGRLRLIHIYLTQLHFVNAVHVSWLLNVVCMGLLNYESNIATNSKSVAIFCVIWYLVENCRICNLIFTKPYHRYFWHPVILSKTF